MVQKIKKFGVKKIGGKKSKKFRVKKNWCKTNTPFV